MEEGWELTGDKNCRGKMEENKQHLNYFLQRVSHLLVFFWLTRQTFVNSQVNSKTTCYQKQKDIF